MTELLSWLTTALQGAAWLAFVAAFVWGILSVLLSPCHLASIPLIVGFIGDQQVRTARQAFVLALLFAAGILITIAVIGAATASLGWMLGDLGRWPTCAVAVILVLVGLHLADVIPISFGGPVQPNVKRKGLLAAFMLGLIFGIALGPCTFAFMAPMIAMTFKAAATTWTYGAALLLLYGVGHCGVIVLAGTSTEWVQRYLGWSEASRGPTVVKRVCGALVVLAGFYLAWRA
jgi:cytochrome c-type biogenesis protein